MPLDISDPGTGEELEFVSSLDGGGFQRVFLDTSVDDISLVYIAGVIGCRNGRVEIGPDGELPEVSEASLDPDGDGFYYVHSGQGDSEAFVVLSSRPSKCEPSAGTTTPNPSHGARPPTTSSPRSTEAEPPSPTKPNPRRTTSYADSARKGASPPQSHMSANKRPARRPAFAACSVTTEATCSRVSRRLHSAAPSWVARRSPVASLAVANRLDVSHEIYGRVRDLIALHLEVVAEQQLPGSLRHARERTDQASSVASSTTGAVPLEIGPWRRGLGRVGVGFLDLEGVRPRSALFEPRRGR